MRKIKIMGKTRKFSDPNMVWLRFHEDDEKQLRELLDGYSYTDF